jgi:signal peptidase II
MFKARRVLFLLAVVSAFVVADQASKLWAVDALTRGATRLYFAGTWGFFEYAENPGAAWNILSGAHESFRYPFFFVVGIVAMTLMTLYYFRAGPEDRLRRVALACIIGGALGNYIDRVRLRYVIDFIVVDLGSFYRWPTFNIADAAISIGVIFLLIESFQQAKRVEA